MTSVAAAAVPMITLLHDGLCPLCSREVALLCRLDRGRGRVAFIDIAAPGFDAAAYGVTQRMLIGAMHGVLADGSMVTGVEVFRRAYGAVGWGWVLAPSRWPVLRTVFDAGYRLFARVRPRLSKHQPDQCELDRCKPRGGDAIAR